jgi:hypothetical protein
MSIIIKEIYASDIDSSGAFWSLQKLDKLNYNFEQIRVAGGGPMGPVGETGLPGEDGVKGVKGLTGLQGATGPQGEKGVVGDSLWIKTNDNSLSYSTLKTNQLDKIYPTTISVGYEELDTNYDSTDQDSVVRIRTKNILDPLDYRNHITLRNVEADDTVNGNRSHTILYQDGISAVLEEKWTDDTIGVFRYEAASHVFTNVNWATIDSAAGFQIHNPVTLNGQVKIDKTIKINTTGVGLGKVLISTDNQGHTAWEKLSNLITTFPIGSIIGVDSALFTDTAFITHEKVSQTGTPKLLTSVGAGKVNGQYEGWYVCNGETWTNGTNSYFLPNLNSFQYDIALNGGDQTHEVTTTNTLGKSFITGADVRVNYYYNFPTYLIDEQTLATYLDAGEQPTIHSNASGANTFSNSKLLYVCYLGASDLKWDTGGNELTWNRTNTGVTVLGFTPGSAPTPTPQPTIYTATRSGQFSKNNCQSGFTTTPVTYTKNYASIISQVIVDNIAASDPNFDSQGQAYANTVGVCIDNVVPTWTATRSGSFTRDNCGSNYVGSTMTYSKQYVSTISQADADAIAAADPNFNTEGQNEVNISGSCTYVPPVYTYYKLNSCEQSGGTVYTQIQPNIASQQYYDYGNNVYYVWDNTSVTDTSSPGVVGNVQLVSSQSGCPVAPSAPSPSSPSGSTSGTAGTSGTGNPVLPPAPVALSLVINKGMTSSTEGWISVYATPSGGDGTYDIRYYIQLSPPSQPYSTSMIEPVNNYSTSPSRYRRDNLTVMQDSYLQYTYYVGAYDTISGTTSVTMVTIS